MAISEALPPPAHPKPTSVAALFGDDSDSQPLWFKKEAFAEDSFDSEAYIADLRRFVPLETLRTELKSHLAALKSELVELINRDYTDFVNLSTKLVDVDGAVLRMRMPLNDLRGKLLGVRESVAGALAALQSGLERRAEASNARQVLELLLDTSHVLSKVEKLLLELEGMPADEARPDDVTAGMRREADSNGLAALGEEPLEAGGAGVGLEEARSRLLERIASEMNRFKFYVARAQDLPFVRSMEKRIAAADASLAARLRQCLEQGLERRDEAVLFHCLRAYAAVDNTAGAEEAFRAAVVAPRVATLVASGAAKGGVSTGGDLLAPLYVELERHVEQDCKFLLNLASAANSGLHPFEFLSNSILREVHTAIQRSRPGAFSPGKPEEFLANYKASLGFLAFLESYCPTQAAMLAFRQSPAHADFLKQWNLGVYFNLRFREIAGALDSALSAPVAAQVAPGDSSAAGGLGLALQASEVLWASLERCWHPDVYLASVSDKFLRLTLQLLARYTAWLNAGLASRKVPQSGGAAVPGGEWAMAASAEDFVLVRHDLELLAATVNGPQLAGRLPVLLGPSVPEEVQVAVRGALQAAAQALLQRTQAVSDVLTDAVAEKCIEVLRQLKGITATYRMTNKPLPIRHSHYVTGVLQPMRTFLEGERAAYLSSPARTELVAWVVDRVTARFDEMARELVSMARKTESSLIRLRRDRRGAAADPSTLQLSDTDKITTQLFLDVQEYGRQLARFGVTPANVPPYVSLWQCVAPADRQQVDLQL